MSQQPPWQPQQPPYGQSQWGQQPPLPPNTYYPPPYQSRAYPFNEPRQVQGMPPQYRPMPPMYPPPPMQPPPKRNRKTWIIIAFIVGAILLLGALANATSESTTTPAPTDTPNTSAVTTPASTSQPTSTPQLTHYPPTTIADLRGLAAKGVVSAIHPFHSESVGLTSVCPQPKREITVDPSVTGQQLAEDLLAYFYAEPLDSPCGSIVFAYHHQAEANDVYTAGRIKFDVTDSSGAENIDPNANNLKHTLTLDIGGAFTNQEYVVTY